MRFPKFVRDVSAALWKSSSAIDSLSLIGKFHLLNSSGKSGTMSTSGQPPRAEKNGDLPEDWTGASRKRVHFHFAKKKKGSLCKLPCSDTSTRIALLIPFPSLSD